MKIISGIALLTLALNAFSAVANVADNVCKVSGTTMSFDLGSSSPATEGSRFFANLEISKNSNFAKPDISISDNSTQYTIHYADGILSDGAEYFVLLIFDRKSNAAFYAFSRAASKTKAAYSTVYSTLPGLNIPEDQNHTLICDVDGVLAN